MAKRNSVWTNKDGLYVGYGTRDVEKNTGGVHTSKDMEHTLSLEIYASDLTDAVAASALENAGVIPANSLIKSADLVVTTAFAGATATLDIGVYSATDNTAVDDDGIDAAIAVGSLTDNAVIACDGADIGTVTAGPVKIAASWDTAAFTAGAARLVLRYVPAMGA